MDNVDFTIPNTDRNLLSTTIYGMIQFGLEQISQQSVRTLNTAGEFAQKYCASSTLHRGHYHPSPVYDLIVGNTKRGRVLAQPGKTTNITHRYLYDQNQELRWIESLHGHKISYIETLFTKDNTIIGVTVDYNGNLAAVSKETYQDSRITSFAILDCYDIGAGCECYSYRQEHYSYDSEGLQFCRMVMFSPKSQYLVEEVYEFERQAGYLTAYRNHKNKDPVPIKYPITRKRKA